MPSPQPRPCDAAVIRAVAAGPPCTARQKFFVLAAAILGSSMVYIDGSAVSVVLPVIQTELAATVSTMQWVVNAYTVFLAALMLIGGSTGDRFGRRRVFMIGIAVFTLASLWCGLSSGAAELAVARGVQGVGGALLVPSNLAIIGAGFDEKERGKAIGTWAAFSAVTAALGPVLGGWLADAVGWRAIFFVNLPLALVTLGIAWRHVPESRGRDAPARQDWPGALLVVCGLGGLAFGLIQSSVVGWSNPAVWGMLLAGGAFFAGFIAAEARRKAPMVPLTLFRARAFGGANLLTLFLYTALGGAFFFLPFDLIQARHYPAAAAGATFLPFTLIIGLLSRWSGGLIDRFGARRPLIIGPLIAAVGFALFARPGLGGSYWVDFFPPMVVLGVGMAISIAPLTTTVMNAVGAERAGIASGINNAVAEVASLLAVAAFGAVALLVFQHALAGATGALALSPEAAQFVAASRGKLGALAPPAVLGPDEARALEYAIALSYLASFRLVMMIAAALAAASSLCAAVMIGPGIERATVARPLPAQPE
jgi:EmrB/QacA subfamily drug resistance transporter